MWRVLSPVLDYLSAHPYLVFVGFLLYVFIFCLSLFMNGKKPGPNPFARSAVKPPKPLVTDTKLRDKVLKQGFGPQKVPDNLDAVIIGSGIGGLTAGVMLAKAGKKVLLLEQHDQAGGCCHTFIEKGFEFDVGIHYIGEMSGSTLVKSVMDFVTDGQLAWDTMGSVFDEVALGDPAKPKRYPLRSGKKGEYRKSLIEKFPDEIPAIDKFLELTKKCKGTTLMFVLLKTLPLFLANIIIKTGLIHLLSSYFKYSTKSLQSTLDELTDNQDLKAVLAYCFGDYGTAPGKVGFAMHATLINHFERGCYYPRGGASEIAYHMIPIIEQSGGRVLVRANVTKILCTPGGRAAGVRVHKGENDYDIFAPYIISAAGVFSTVTKLLPKQVAEKSVLSKLLSRVEHGTACMSVFLGLRGTSEELQLPPCNTWAFTRSDLNDACEEYLSMSNEEAAKAEVPLLFVSFPSTKDSTHLERYPGKSTCTVVTLANWRWFEEWQNDRVKHRSQGYEDIKNGIGQQMVRQTMALFPQLEGKVEYMEIGTPLSNNYYIGSPRGEIYGMDHGMKRFSPEYVVNLRPKTDIPGLILAGQDVFTCGMVGAMFGGVGGASAVLHRNLFRDAISYKKQVDATSGKNKDD